MKEKRKQRNSVPLDIERIVRQAMQKIIEEDNSYNGPVELSIGYRPDNDNWSYIKANRDKLWKFLEDGYRKAGYDHFCGCDNIQSLLKNANLVVITFMGEEWIAVSVYTGYRGGHKCVGITATTDETLRANGVNAVRRTIKNDIGNYADFFWAECSGSIEKLYEKYEGIKIPNEYAYPILQKRVETEGEDEFHYRRMIKGELQRKIIFGFNSKETYERVLREREEYIRKCLDNIEKMKVNEGKERPAYGKLDEIGVAIAVVNFFLDERWEGENYEFPKSALTRLKEKVDFLEKAAGRTDLSNIRREEISKAIENGNDIISTSSTMNFFSFK